MNSIFISIGVLLFFFVLAFLAYDMKKCPVKSFLLSVFAVVVGAAVFFQEGIGGAILTKYDFYGKIQRIDAENYVREAYADVAVYYSWYGSKEFHPAIFVMAEKDGRQGKIIIDAFSGKVFSSKFPRTKELSYYEFSHSKKTAGQGDINPTPAIPPEEPAAVDRDPPKIEISSPKDSEQFPAGTESVMVEANVWDAVDKNPKVDGTGKFILTEGFNSVIVTATDASGNVGTAFVVVEKLSQ